MTFTLTLTLTYFRFLANEMEGGRAVGELLIVQITLY